MGFSLLPLQVCAVTHGAVRVNDALCHWTLCLCGIFSKLHTVLGSWISALACSAVYMLC